TAGCQPAFAACGVVDPVRTTCGSGWVFSQIWMTRGYPHTTDESGVTLIELLVVIVIIVIVCAIALMQRGSADAQFKRQNVARELKVAFERARFDSVKRRAQASPEARVTVVVDTSSYALTTYTVDS